MVRRTLIVDDEESILTILEIMLRREGFEVFTAPTGEKALEIFQKEDHNFDLIITDVVMPRMDGYEMSMRILELVPDQPILFISGFNSSKDLMSLIESKTNLQYQSKPFVFDDIKRKIEQIL